RQRAHVGERQRNRASVSPNIGAGARLIEIEPRARPFQIAECRACDVEGLKRDAPALERREQRLLPFGMFVKDDQGGSGWRHGVVVRQRSPSWARPSAMAGTVDRMIFQPSFTRRTTSFALPAVMPHATLRALHTVR